MTRSAHLSWLLLLAFGLLARSESLSTFPASVQAASSSAPPTSAPTAAATPSPVAQPQNVQQNKPTNETKEFNPFGVMGGNDNGDGSNASKPLPTDSSTTIKPSATPSATSAPTTKQATDTAKTATGSNTITLIQTTASQGATQISALTPGYTGTPSSAASTTNANLAKVTQSGTSQSSGTSSYSWKILGVGVLAFVGVVVIILCSAFSDSILRTIRSPFKKRDEEDDVLVPDWRRGSWRVGMDDPDGRGRYPEKDGTQFVVEDYSGYGEQEKSGMAMNGHPVSPFPRRSPSVRTGVARSPGLEVGDGNARSARGQTAGGYSIYPSPPPPAHTFTSIRGDGDCDPFADPHAVTHLDAYGGME